MKVLVACKVCPDLDLLQENDCVVRGEMGVDTHFLPNLLNCYDESSLELALRLRDQAEGPVELSALSVGGEQAEIYLKTLQALGYDHPVWVRGDEEALRFRPEPIAETLAAYARQTGQDVLLLGREAPVGNHGATAQLVAGRLGYPLVSSVIDVRPAGDSLLEVWTLECGCRMQYTVSTPCVLSVGNAVVSKLRIPSLRMRMKWKNIPCESYPLQTPETAGYPMPVGLAVPDRRRRGYVSPEKGAAAVADLFAQGLQERLERL